MPAVSSSGYALGFSLFAAINSWHSSFFSRDVVLGGNCFCGERKCEYPKKQAKFIIVWGGNSKLSGGEFPPPKGPEKNTAGTVVHITWFMVLNSHACVDVAVTGGQQDCEGPIKN